MAGNGGGMISLNVDISEVRDTVTAMTRVFDNKQMHRIIHDTVSDTAKKTKTIVKRIVAKEYCVTQGWAAKQIGNYYTRGEFNVTIPLSGHRGSIGGTFQMQLDRALKTSSGKAGKHRNVKSAKIRRGKTFPLSHASSRQGGGQIFALNKVALTRHKGKLVRVVGRSLPQMVVDSPSNETVGKEISTYMLKRVDRHINRALNNFK